ncbi:NPC intracellular cholesterol transporter 2 homolog a-like [Odontomachus brunneus]|uniref:NPC intracellular cholesterol transporter 2 homolog a-like n=1 Tax=Odontomachus brunneus TaxID=486640 RepID=UPI0013F1A29F|nr:NPC intracellular cholesterol transporter 2 homolog a-like [Odontomachus brunneus]
MNRIAIMFALLCALSSTLAFNFEDCGSEIGKFGDITISSCTPSSKKCIVNRGDEAHMSVKFTPNKDISNLEVRIYTMLQNVPVPFPLEKPNMCKDSNSGIKCPLKKDEEVEYKTTLVVDKDVPVLNVDIMLQFVNENDHKVICVKFPAKIK